MKLFSRSLFAETTSRSWQLAAVIAIAMTLASGWLHGRITQRWHDNQTFRAAADQLATLPEQAGEWTAVYDHELGNSAIELLQCQGYVHRTYRHLQSGREVRVAVLLGPGSKMAIHVPEICLEAKNFTLLQPRTRLQVNRRADQLWLTRFQINDVSERKMAVLYGWRARDHWQAPKFPRLSVAKEPLLYKFQLTIVESRFGGASEQVASDFLQDFLPRLDPHLL